MQFTRYLQLVVAVIGLIMRITISGYCQQGTNISGTIRDSLTQEPIRFATVVLLTQQSKAPVKETQTDTSGHFVLENVPEGTFSMRITYVGYKDIFSENIMVDPSRGEPDFRALTMTASKSYLLKEVTVDAKKEALRNVNGKKIFLVNQSLVSKGGNAADLLRNVPTLQVDGDGNVSLRGSVNVKVLIDGKPTIIANSDITKILQSIPASAIESVEVIPNLIMMPMARVLSI